MKQPKENHAVLEKARFIYTSAGLEFTQLSQETESLAYGAHRFSLNGVAVVFRVAKVIPIKIGQFVSLWQRSAKGPTQPYAVSDPVDFYIIAVQKEACFGQFIFPKAVLSAQGVLSRHGQGGKRALRLYPVWDKALNKQAQATQQWQLKYFLDGSNEHKINASYAQLADLLAACSGDL